MKSLARLAAAVAFAVTASVAIAETPKDTLVQAWVIDDIISLDPAEIFEFSAGEIAGNTYERLIGYDLDDVSKIFGVVAESWSVSDDGKTVTFKIREGRTFASGNPITAEDVVFSLQRVVLLDKTPAFIITQFGINKDNVKDTIKQSGDYELTFTMDKPYAPSFLLYCLTATVASVVDKKVAMEHEKDGDFGYEWLKTHYAGSGPFTIKDWRANEAAVLERNENYSGEKTPLARVLYRHVKENAAQRLLLEKGDIDLARGLGAEELGKLTGNPDIAIQSKPKGTLYYIGMNQKNEMLAKPEVREALKYLVDYQTIADTIVKGQGTVHQAFLPDGFLGAVNDTPFSLNVAKAKELLAKAGYADGFSLTMDVRNSMPFTGIAEAVQRTFAEAGIKVELSQMDFKQLLTRYRARQHELSFVYWGPDYQDPHTNAQTFSANPNNADDSTLKTLAWRNAWDPGDLTQRTDAAILERDAEKRAAIYQDMQTQVMNNGPFIIMYQETETVAMRKNVSSVVLGPSFDTNSFATTRKD